MDLTDLYQDIIVDHNRRPRNCRKLERATHSAEGFNPLCGDRLTVYLRLADGRIEDVSFQGEGCAISVASASLMTEALKGCTETEARALFERMHDLVTHEVDPEEVQRLGRLGALSGVRAYPSRVKCAILCWHTVNAALEKQHAPVSTE